MAVEITEGETEFRLEVSSPETHKTLNAEVTKELIADFEEMYGGSVVAVLADALEREMEIELQREIDRKKYTFSGEDGSTVECNPVRRDNNVILLCERHESPEHD